MLGERVLSDQGAGCAGVEASEQGWHHGAALLKGV